MPVNRGMNMKEKKLINLYNDYLSPELSSYCIKSWDDLNEKSQKDLGKLIDFFSAQLIEIGLDELGEVNSKGVTIDEIIGQINIKKLQLKEK
jgi:hypothetical protein